MKVLFDTCVVVDILARGRFFADSFAAYDVALFKKMDVCLSVSSTTDIVYLLHARASVSKAAAREAARQLVDLFDVIDNTETDIRRASESDMPDYEDALIAYAALRNGVDFIVTRNAKDFAKSPVSVMEPGEFVRLFKPSCLNYEEVPLPEIEEEIPDCVSCNEAD